MLSPALRNTLALMLFVAALAFSGTMARSNTTTTKTVHPAPPKSASHGTTTFSGASDKGDFEEALDTAIESAMESRSHVADAMVEWKLKEVSGVRGGFAGMKKLTVTIEVKPR